MSGDEIGQDPPKRRYSGLAAIMIAVAVAGIDFALAKALARTRPDRIGVAIIIVAYDALAYFTGLAIYKLLHERRTGPGSWIVLTLAIIILGLCAGLPLLAAVAVIFLAG